MIPTGQEPNTQRPKSKKDRFTWSPIAGMTTTMDTSTGAQPQNESGCSHNKEKILRQSRTKVQKFKISSNSNRKKSQKQLKNLIKDNEVKGVGNRKEEYYSTSERIEFMQRELLRAKHPRLRKFIDDEPKHKKSISEFRVSEFGPNTRQQTRRKAQILMNYGKRKLVNHSKKRKKEMIIQAENQKKRMIEAQNKYQEQQKEFNSHQSRWKTERMRRRGAEHSSGNWEQERASKLSSRGPRTRRALPFHSYSKNQILDKSIEKKAVVDWSKFIKSRQAEQKQKLEDRGNSGLSLGKSQRSGRFEAGELTTNQNESSDVSRGKRGRGGHHSSGNAIDLSQREYKRKMWSILYQSAVNSRKRSIALRAETEPNRDQKKGQNQGRGDSQAPRNARSRQNSQKRGENEKVNFLRKAVGIDQRRRIMKSEGYKQSGDEQSNFRIATERAQEEISKNSIFEGFHKFRLQGVMNDSEGSLIVSDKASNPLLALLGTEKKAYFDRQKKSQKRQKKTNRTRSQPHTSLEITENSICVSSFGSEVQRKQIERKVKKIKNLKKLKNTPILSTAPTPPVKKKRKRYQKMIQKIKRKLQGDPKLMVKYLMDQYSKHPKDSSRVPQRREIVYEYKIYDPETPRITPRKIKRVRVPKTKRNRNLKKKLKEKLQSNSCDQIHTKKVVSAALYLTEESQTDLSSQKIEKIENFEKVKKVKLRPRRPLNHAFRGTLRGKRIPKPRKFTRMRGLGAWKTSPDTLPDFMNYTLETG